MTVDSIQLGETYQRNPLLASFCAKTMVYRGLGSGIIRAKNDGAKIEFRNDEVTNQFIATIWRDTKEKGLSKDEKGVSLEGNSASMNKKGVSLEENSASNDKKGVSLEQNSASNDKKGVSLEQNSASNDKKGVSKRELTINKILSFCKEPKSITEIANYLGMGSRYKLKVNYINTLLKNKMAMTKPDLPTSPHQKYYTIPQKEENNE